MLRSTFISSHSWPPNPHDSPFPLLRKGSRNLWVLQFKFCSGSGPTIRVVLVMKIMHPKRRMVDQQTSIGATEDIIRQCFNSQGWRGARGWMAVPGYFIFFFSFFQNTT